MIKRWNPHFSNLPITRTKSRFPPESIPLTNRVRGPYCKFFFSSISGREKKRGSVTYSTDREDEVSKIFIKSLLCLTGSGATFYSRVTALNY